MGFVFHSSMRSLIHSEVFLHNLIFHYKTTFFGLISLLIGGYIGFVNGDWITASPLISSGIGLCIASDGDKSEASK